MIGLFSWNVKIVIFALTFCGLGYANDYDEVYREISDIRNPTKSDWIKLQKYINRGERPYLESLNTFDLGGPNDGCRYDLRARKFNFLGNKKGASDFLLHKEYIHSESEDRDRCIICYASYNANFPKKVKRLIERLKQSKFKGHFLYRIGGWPDVKGGSLKLIHVPYAFKVCLFKEAKRLGYKRVLWMDTSFKPLRDFNEIFRMIKREGYFITSLDKTSLRDRGSKKVQTAFDLSDDEMIEIKEVASGLIGVDFSNERGREIIDRWYKAAEQLDPFLSPRPEQSALAALLYKMDLHPTCSFYDITAIYASNINPKHYFYLDY